MRAKTCHATNDVPSTSCHGMSWVQAAENHQLKEAEQIFPKLPTHFVTTCCYWRVLLFTLSLQWWGELNSIQVLKLKSATAWLTATKKWMHMNAGRPDATNSWERTIKIFSASTSSICSGEQSPNELLQRHGPMESTKQKRTIALCRGAWRRNHWALAAGLLSHGAQLAEVGSRRLQSLTHVLVIFPLSIQGAVTVQMRSDLNVVGSYRLCVLAMFCSEQFTWSQVLYL